MHYRRRIEAKKFIVANWDFLPISSNPGQIWPNRMLRLTGLCSSCHVLPTYQVSSSNLSCGRRIGDLSKIEGFVPVFRT
ncbi:hypothetical protein RchiOBHm_Chr4g0401941 [Rosa chinensis]|uniref:Uncharacterized protein n=1 Tax=Rosa chinensis TaxID=74649 RepID=A0A2P6QT69_ROSCH|nr:hypothetical protein RchiOBHm_Chr4g0401941 [Rosa chinensis]